MILDPRLRRLDATRLRVDNPYGIDAVLFANEQVPVEASAVSELLQLLTLQETLEQVARAAPGSFDERPAIHRVAVTPDFHKARGIPVGTVLATRGFIVPQAIGDRAAVPPTRTKSFRLLPASTAPRRFFRPKSGTRVLWKGTNTSSEHRKGDTHFRKSQTNPPVGHTSTLPLSSRDASGRL